MDIEWQFTLYAIPLLLSALATSTLFLGVLLYRDRTRAVFPLLGVLLASTLWAMGDGMRVLTVTRPGKLFWNNVRFLGGSFITQAMFLLVIEYVNKDHWITRRRIALISVVPILTNLVAWTNQYHFLLREPTMLERTTILGTELVTVSLDYGIWYDVHLLYSYPFLLVAAYVLFRYVTNSSGVEVYRMQSIMLLCSFLVPVALNLPFVFGVVPVDLTSFGFGITSVAFVMAVTRYRLLDILPIARQTVVDTMDSGVLVLDPDNYIVDVNERTAEILGVEQSSLLGETIESVFSDYPEVIETFGGAREKRDQIALDIGGETRQYDVTMSSIHDGDRYLGQVTVFQDITDHVRRKRELEAQTRKLERQNERLENFANVVSHDLRNPLNAASGHLELVKETSDDAHLDEIGDNLDRMSQIIDDVLTLAHQGQTDPDTDSLDLERVVAAARRNVDCNDVTLDYERSYEIEADEGRLLRALENLFRNAVEHGDEDVTVTVGLLDEGFYVADDGPGIPEDERDLVFEQGYSTTEAGTGFGLAIIDSIVEGHGWTIEVTESADGGARFEFRGVDAFPKTKAT